MTRSIQQFKRNQRNEMFLFECVRLCGLNQHFGWDYNRSLTIFFFQFYFCVLSFFVVRNDFYIHYTHT